MPQAFASSRPGHGWTRRSWRWTRQVPAQWVSEPRLPAAVEGAVWVLPHKPCSGPLTSSTNQQERGQETGHLPPSFWNKGCLGRQEKRHRNKFWASWVGCPPVVPPVDGRSREGAFLQATHPSFQPWASCRSPAVQDVLLHRCGLRAARVPLPPPGGPLAGAWQPPGNGEGAEEKGVAVPVWTFSLCSERGTCQPVPSSSACTASGAELRAEACAEGWAVSCHQASGCCVSGQRLWPSSFKPLTCYLFIFQCKWSRKGFVRTRWSVADWYVYCTVSTSHLFNFPLLCFAQVVCVGRPSKAVPT